jgi:hypothetical protein
MCLQCGREIPRKRLDVQPWARHCVACQELEEKGLLQPHPYPGEGGEFGEDVDAEDSDYEVRLPARAAVEDEEEEEEDEEEEDDEDYDDEDYDDEDEDEEEDEEEEEA